MTSMFSRRKMLSLFAALPFMDQRLVFAAPGKIKKPAPTWPSTLSALETALRIETAAYEHYVSYTRKALSENYPNIAYLFYAFSFSEKIHAENYRRILATLGEGLKDTPLAIDMQDTKSNLQNAARKELEKIETTYPDLLKKLENESHEEAVIHCMYSWKSHQQHEEKIREILRYSGWFFGSVASEIEGLNLNFHICRACGSTLDAPPRTPCPVCNRPKSNYWRVARPT